MRGAQAKSLNIKNEATVRLVHELAARRGISLVKAVDGAVREVLEREAAAEDPREKKKGLVEKWLKIAREETAPILRQGPSYQEIMDDMYDEMGLPK